MRTKQKFAALLLALVLFAGTGPAAYAASRTELVWENGKKEGSIYLDLENISGTVYGIQLELTLAGNYPDCTFTPDSRSVYSPDCAVDASRSQTKVTIYLTDTEPLNSRDSLTLGTLDLGVQETVKANVLPDNARVIALNRDLMDSSMTVSVTEAYDTPDSSGSSSSGRKPAQPDTEPAAPDTGTSTPEPSVPEPVAPQLPLVFTDVKAADWFYSAVQFVYSRGMMTGVSETAFAPNATTTRGMIVTILHRLEGSPSAPAAPFADVPAGEYYAAPVAWAATNGIVTGYSDTIFQPNTPITREQMAAILYRYAQYKKVDVSRRNTLTQFGDREKVSSYAVDAMSWAVEAGLITGIDGQLEPAGSATRAQVATILMRFCENVLAN